MNFNNLFKKKEVNPMVEKAPKKSFVNFSAIKAYTVFIVSIAVITGVTIWVILPGYSKFKELNEDIEKQEKELEKYTAQANFMQSLYEKKDELIDNIETAKLSMADEEDAIPYILDQIIQISEESEVELSGLSLGGVSPVGEVEGLYEIRINTKIDGSYDQVMDYLDRIQNAQRLVDVVNVSISLDHDESNEQTTVIPEDEETTDPFANEDEDEITNVGPHFSMNLSLSSYYMEEVDVSKLSVERLAQESSVDNVLIKIKELEYYEPNEDAIYQEIGKDNPFQIGEFKDGEFVEDEDEDEDEEENTDERNIPDL